MTDEPTQHPDPGEELAQLADTLPQVSAREIEAFRILLGIARKLRGPDGCPWDREQTLDSMTSYLVEETHELTDAIDARDPAAVREEAGDLVFLVLFCTQIEHEAGHSKLEDVLLEHARKLVRRHPHVFGDAVADTPEAVKTQWEAIKKAEKGARTQGSALSDRPKGLPALADAQRIQERVAAVGFDWPDLAPVIDKVDEELGELHAEIESGEPASRAAELGDLLFAVVNLARHLRIDPERALRSTTTRFIHRFQHVEDTLSARGRSTGDASLEEMDALWDEAKAAEKDPPSPGARGKG